MSSTDNKPNLISHGRPCRKLGLKVWSFESRLTHFRSTYPVRVCIWTHSSHFWIPIRRNILTRWERSRVGSECRFIISVPLATWDLMRFTSTWQTAANRHGPVILCHRVRFRNAVLLRRDAPQDIPCCCTILLKVFDCFHSGAWPSFLGAS